MTTSSIVSAIGKRLAAPVAAVVVATGLVVAAPAVESVAAAPFACTSDFFWVQNAQLVEGSPLNDPFGTAVGAPNPSGRYNALGHNIEDGYLYGIGSDGEIANQLVRIDDAGTVTPLGVPAGLPAGFFQAGTFDDAGNLWVSITADFDLYQIDVSTNSVVRVVVPSVTPATGINIGADIVWRDGAIIRLLGGNPGRVHMTDTSDGTATVITSTQGVRSALAAPPALWLSGDDRLFFANSSGAISEVVAWQTDAFTVRSLGTGNLGTNGDGASCSSAVSPFGLAAADDDYSGTPLLAVDGGVVGNIWTNDLRDAAPLDPASVTTALLDDGGLPGVTLGTDGSVSVPAGAEPGTYAFTYEICSVATPTECARATITVLLVEEDVVPPGGSVPPGSEPAGVTPAQPELPATGAETVPTIGLVGLLLLALGALTVAVMRRRSVA